MEHKTFPYQNPWRLPISRGCHVNAKRVTRGFQQIVSFLSIHSKVSIHLLTFSFESHFHPPTLGVCMVRFSWFCMCMANRNWIFRLVKFSTKTDQNGWKSNSFSGISVSIFQREGLEANVRRPVAERRFRVIVESGVWEWLWSVEAVFCVWEWEWDESETCAKVFNFLF